MSRFCLFLCLFSAAFILCGADNIACHLLPTPKSLEVKGNALFTGNCFVITDNFGLSEKKKARFVSALKDKLSWQKSDEGKIKITFNKLDKAPVDNSEYYVLELSENNVAVSAAGESGIMRGISRFCGIINSPLFKASFEGDFTVPAMVIKDYPDFKLRPVMLGVAALFPKTDKKMLLAFIDDFIEKAFAMQFNCIAFELGGRLKMAKYPDINQPGPVFTAEELSDVIDHCNERGMSVIPMINTIGHFGRSPVICTATVPGTKRKFMNIADPRCLPVLFDYIDEVVRVFRNPRYFCIGTDEFNREYEALEKLSGKPFHEFYPEYVNKVNAHLKKQGVATLVYHDMFMPRGMHPYPEETGSGPADQGLKALGKIDKDVHILYWNYFHSHKYPFLADLKKSGVKNIWVLPHSGADAVRELFKRSLELGSNIMATSWFLRLQSNCYPHAAEYSWNIHKDFGKNEYDFNDANDALFYARDKRAPELKYHIVKFAGGYAMPEHYEKKFAAAFPGTRVSASGIPFDFSFRKTISSPAVELERKVGVAEAKKLFDGKKKVYMSAENAVVSRKLARFKLNGVRKYQDIAVYTPEHGKTTRTDRKGLEIAVDKEGRVCELSGNCFQRTGDEKGNMAIPEGGFVVAYGNSQPYLTHPGYDLFFKLKKGEKFYFSTDNSKKAESKIISAGLSGKYRRVAIALTCIRPVRQGRVGLLEIKMKQGKSHFVRINGNIFTTGPCVFIDDPAYKRFNPWPAVRYGINPVVVLDIPVPHSSQIPRSLYMSVTRDGAASGVSVLGITQY